jgi:hypothetical protein
MKNLMGTVAPDQAPPDRRKLTTALMENPLVETTTLAIPVPTPGKPGSLRTRFLRRMVLVMQPETYLPESLRIPMEISTVTEPGETTWSDFQVKILGCRATMSLAVLETTLMTETRDIRQMPMLTPTM